MVAITWENKVVTWGTNRLLYTTEKTDSTITGQLGHREDEFSGPRVVTGIEGDVIAVSCGWAHTAVLTSSALYTFGSNEFGQLGRSGLGSSALPVRTIMDQDGSPAELVYVSCGAFFTMALSGDGTLFGWGSNSHGQLGTGSPKAMSFFPRRVALEGVVHVACGFSHTVACTATGQVYTCGSNIFGEVGLSAPLESKAVQQKQLRPALVTRLDGAFITNVSCGPYSTVACSLTGDAYVWGLLAGVNFTDHQWLPRRIERLHEQFVYVARASCGTSHMVFMSDMLTTKALRVLAGACKYEGAFNLLQVKMTILSLPDIARQLGPIQDRVLESLHRESQNLRPYLAVDTPFLSFLFVSHRKVVTRTFTITNPTNVPVKVSALLEGAIPNSLSMFAIKIKPKTFTLAAKSKIVVCLLVCSCARVLVCSCARVLVCSYSLVDRS